LVGHGENGCAEGKQAQQVVDWKVKLPGAVSAAAVILRIPLPFCGKFTQLNLFFKGCVQKLRVFFFVFAQNTINGRHLS